MITQEGPLSPEVDAHLSTDVTGRQEEFQEETPSESRKQKDNPRRSFRLGKPDSLPRPCSIVITDENNMFRKEIL